MSLLRGKKVVWVPVVVVTLFMYISTWSNWSRDTEKTSYRSTWYNVLPTGGPLVRKKLSYTSQNMAYDICDTFDFDPVEWTLHWKSPYNKITERTYYCRRLHDSIFKEKTVKWIVYPNKTIENLGCTKHTPACKEGAHYDTKRNVRINTPPCCRAKMLEMLEILTTGLQRLKIPHVLIGGAVIGWIRNKELIPYDEDFDMYVNGSDWDKPEFKAFLKEMNNKHGFVTWWRESDWISVVYSAQNYNGAGVWPYRIGKKGEIYVPYRYPIYDYATMNPPRFVKFSGIATYIPNKPERYCDEVYGKGNWERELECKKTNTDRKCIG